jgi:large subunit ribosomal protein L29
MKMQQFKEMTDAELDNQLNELLQEKLKLKIHSRTGQLEKTARVKQVRKDIARVKTEKQARLAKANA